MQQVLWGMKQKQTFIKYFENILLFCSFYSEVRIVDKITDLPVNYSKYLTNRRPQTVQSRSGSSANGYDQQQQQQYQQQAQPQMSQTEPAQQYRTTTYNYPG